MPRGLANGDTSTNSVADLPLPAGRQKDEVCDATGMIVVMKSGT